MSAAAAPVISLSKISGFTPAVNTKGKTIGYINPAIITTRTTHDPSTPLTIETSSSSRAEKILRTLFVSNRNMKDFMRLSEKVREIIVNLEYSIFTPDERQFTIKSCFDPCNWWIDHTSIPKFIELKKRLSTPAIQLIRAGDYETVEIQCANNVPINWVDLFQKFSMRCDLPHMMQVADKLGAEMPKFAWGNALEIAIKNKNKECFDYLTARPDLCELNLTPAIVWCVKVGAIDFLPTIIEMGGDPKKISYQENHLLELHAHRPSVEWLLTHCNYYIHKRGYHYD